MRFAASRVIAGVGVVVLGLGCGPPVGVRRVDPRDVHRALTASVLTTGAPSGPSAIVLHRYDLTQRFKDDPEGALAELRDRVVSGRGGSDEIFALSELSFLHAERSGKRSYFLASAVYAWAFLFPDDDSVAPSRFDPRLRLACDIYNRGVTEGFASPDRTEVVLRSGTYELPFGELAVTLDPDALRWGNRELTRFVAVADLEVHGLSNRYRHSGIGAPLAASTVPLPGLEDRARGFVAPRTKVPVTAVLRLEDPRRQLAATRLDASLEVYAMDETESVNLDGRRVPLEVEPTSALAYGLNDSPVWKWEKAGFLQGDLFLREAPTPGRLASLVSYRPDRIPVVLVHGTVSSPGRWAEMVNDLENDPLINGKFQFWFFYYNSGNPIAYSANLLRHSLTDAVATLDPDGNDPCLRHMVVIGHSQGGLLTKMTVIESGPRLWERVSKRPLNELDLSDETRELLRDALFVEPLPFVERVIFIATPHRGSFMAGKGISRWVASFAKMPGILADAGQELFQGNRDELKVAVRRMASSVDNMSPGAPFIEGLASIPVAPGVASHSIIPVKGNGAFEGGNDGVVEYSSAHLEDVDSELVVRSSHSCQANPHTIEEVRRILLLHAERTSCAPAGGESR